MPPKAVDAVTGKILMTRCAAIKRQTKGLNHARGDEVLLSPLGMTKRCAVEKSAMKTITRSAISVTSGIMLRN